MQKKQMALIPTWIFIIWFFWVALILIGTQFYPGTVEESQIFDILSFLLLSFVSIPTGLVLGHKAWSHPRECEEFYVKSLDRLKNFLGPLYKQHFFVISSKSFLVIYRIASIAFIGIGLSSFVAVFFFIR
jgi:hypothetical protein